jgi:hypothetical protein
MAPKLQEPQVKSLALREIIKEIRQEKGRRIALPRWGNWMNWRNWTNWANWRNSVN